ncbi:MAG: hypothetical protein IPP09_06765 [Elusimicrobia bacterium]|nr:hypothetical protein [Elusimicrobiota bacterium]
MTRTMVVHGDRTREACRLGHLLATDVADALARRGVPFREAHGAVARVVTDRRKPTGLGLEDLPCPFGTT